MDRVEERYRDFCNRFEAEGFADPNEFTHELEPADERELRALIEYFVSSQSPREWDADAYRGSPAERAVERLLPQLKVDVAPWSDLLPRLRNEARIKRDSLAEMLAKALGLGDSQKRVKFYYHHMEHGNLPAAGVSDRVLTCLGEILNVDADELRRSGAAQGPPPDPEVAHIFARRVTGSTHHGTGQARLTPDLSGEGEVDRLFTGGNDETS